MRSNKKLLKQQRSNLKPYIGGKCKYKKLINDNSWEGLYYRLDGKTTLNVTTMPEQFIKLFKKIQMNARKLQNKYRQSDQIITLRMISKLVPDNFFGADKNRKAFNHILEMILTRSFFECIYKSNLINGYDLEKILWLQSIAEEKRPETLLMGIQLILNVIINPLIRKVFYALRVGQTHEIQFVPHKIMRSYTDKVLSHLLKQDYIEKVVDQKSTLVLEIKPKNGLEDYTSFRPYVKETTQKTCSTKLMNQSIYKYARRLCKTKTDKLYHYWCEYYEATSNQKLYGAKLDLSDAYGNVPVADLKNLLKKCPTHIISGTVVARLISMLDNQYVYSKFSKHRVDGNKREYNIYRWKHGLLQGHRLSAALCELYLSYMDGTSFYDFMKPSCFLHRTADDYFFCSTEKEDVVNFMLKAKYTFELNDAKLQHNLDDNCAQIDYCGQTFNLLNRNVTKLYSFPEKYQIYHRFRLWNYNMQLTSEANIAKALYYPYNNNYFKHIEINLLINTKETVLQNYFHGMIMVAFKYDSAIMAMVARKITNNSCESYLFYILRKNVLYYAEKCHAKVATGFDVDIFKKIGYIAFQLVLQKRQGVIVYKFLVGHIKAMRYGIVVEDFDESPYRTLPNIFDNISIGRKYCPYQMKVVLNAANN